MSPLMINILLECFCSGAPGDNVQPRIWNSEAARDARAELVRKGLIDPDTLKTTPAGNQLVDRLCAVEPSP